MARERYTVIYERGDRPGQWLAHVEQLPECHTFGRGLEQTRARIREALVLWKGAGAASAEIAEILPLPGPLRRKIDALTRLRDQAERLERERQDQLAAVVAAMLRDWSTRDIGDVLGVSHQRVHQVSRKRTARVVTSGRSTRVRN